MAEKKDCFNALYDKILLKLKGKVYRMVVRQDKPPKFKCWELQR